jgi:hypothetical protein
MDLSGVSIVAASQAVQDIQRFERLLGGTVTR